MVTLGLRVRALGLVGLGVFAGLSAPACGDSQRTFSSNGGASAQAGAAGANGGQKTGGSAGAHAGSSTLGGATSTSGGAQNGGALNGGTPGVGAANGGVSGEVGGGDAGAPGVDGGAAGAGGETGTPQCVSECTAGAQKCGTSGVQNCELQTTGCTAWVTTTVCGPHQKCAESAGTATCQCDASICSKAGSVCQDGQTVATCTTDANQCLYVSASQKCTSPESCGGVAPSATCSLSCSNTCSQGQTACVDGGLATCTLGSNGCWAYGAPVACASSHQACTGSAGSAACTCKADPVCKSSSATCASTTSLAACAKDAQGCFYASATSTCNNGACSGGACCTNSCTAGQKSCVNGGLATCTLGSNGCYSYGTPAACPSTHQSCTGSAGSGACTCTADAVCKSSAATCSSSTTLANCAQDAQGCFFANSTSTCSNGACSGGACCTNACTSGQKTCVSGGLATCALGSNGCYSYGTPVACTTTGSVCSGSACVCPSGTTLCGSACVNLTSDANNCGACGRSCFSSNAATGQCSASKCQPFALQNIGPLTPPLLIEPQTVPLGTDAARLFATLSGTAAVSLNAQTGAILQSPANIYRPSNFGPSGIFAQTSTLLYGLDNSSGSASIVGITKSTMAPFTVTFSQPTGTDYWLGVVPGSVDQICVLVNSDIFYLHCRTGTSGTTASVCTNGPDSVCPGVGEFAADASGVVWGPEGFFLEEGGTTGENAFKIATSVTSPTTLTLPVGTAPSAVIVDANFIYWYDSASRLFYKTARKASGATTQLSSTAIARVPAQLALDSTYLYWTDTAVGTVSRVAISGSAPLPAPAVIASGQVGPTGIAVDANAIYWINGSGNSLMKMRKP